MSNHRISRSHRQSVDPPPNDDPLYTLGGAAEYLSVSKEWVRRRVRDGQIPALRLDNSPTAIRVRRSALDSLMEEHESTRARGRTQR